MPRIDLYSIFKPLVGIASLIYFKKVYVINEEYLPIGKKALYTLNHPTSFVDPILLVSQTKPYLHFLIRGDVFKKGLALKMLKSIHGIPIFRRSDTSNSGEKNKETFEQVSDVLHLGDSVMVMPEGSTDKTRRLRPFKKGFAHMAFHYRNKYKMDDLYIVPVALSYSDPSRFRSVVHVHISKPILLSDYTADYDTNPSIGINKLKNDLYSEMRRNIVHIDRDEDLELVDKGIKMIHHSYHFSLLPIKDTPGALLNLERGVSETVNQMDKASRQVLEAKMGTYEEYLKTNGTSDRIVADDTGFNPFRFIWNILISPAAILGYLVNFTPLFAAKKLAYKLMKREEFICSVKLGASTIFYLIYSFSIFLSVSLMVSFKVALLALLALPLLGLLYIYFRGSWIRNITSLKAALLSKGVKNDLKKMRSEILSHFAS